MMTYCLKCRKNTKNIDAKMIRTKNGRVILSSKCDVCSSKKSRFMNETRSKRNIK